MGTMEIDVSTDNSNFSNSTILTFAPEDISSSDPTQDTVKYLYVKNAST